MNIQFLIVALGIWLFLIALGHGFVAIVNAGLREEPDQKALVQTCISRFLLLSLASIFLLSWANLD